MTKIETNPDRLQALYGYLEEGGGSLMRELDKEIEMRIIYTNPSVFYKSMSHKMFDLDKFKKLKAKHNARLFVFTRFLIKPSISTHTRMTHGPNTSIHNWNFGFLDEIYLDTGYARRMVE